MWHVVVVLEREFHLRSRSYPEIVQVVPHLPTKGLDVYLKIDLLKALWRRRRSLPCNRIRGDLFMCMVFRDIRRRHNSRMDE